MKKRIFIIGPAYDTDTLYIIASTTHKDALLNIYQADRYEEIGSATSYKKAEAIAKRHGAKRPTTI